MRWLNVAMAVLCVLVLLALVGAWLGFNWIAHLLGALD